MAAAALVTDSSLNLPTPGLASALGWGEPGEGHFGDLRLSLKSEGLYLFFLKSLYRVIRIELVFIFNLCFPVSMKARVSGESKASLGSNSDYVWWARGPF